MQLDFTELEKGVNDGLEKQAKSPDYFQQLEDREREQQRRFSAVPSWSTPLEPTAIPKPSFASPAAMPAAQVAPETIATKITREAKRKKDYMDQGLDMLKDTAVKIPPTRPPTLPITAPLAASPTAPPEDMRADQLHTGFFDSPDLFSRQRTHGDVVNRVDIAARARDNELTDYYGKAENALRRTGNPQQMDDFMAEKKEAFWQHNAKFQEARKFTLDHFPKYQRQMADYNANQAAQAKATAAGYDPLRSTGQGYTKVTPPTFPTFDPNNEYLAATFPNANPRSPYTSSQAQQPLSTPTAPTRPTTTVAAPSTSTPTPTSTALPPGLQQAIKLQNQQAADEEKRKQLFNIGGISQDPSMPGREVTVLGQTFKIPTSTADYQQQAKTTLPGPVGDVVAKAEGAVGDAAKIVGNTVSGGIDLTHDVADRGFVKGVLHHNFPEAYNTLSKAYHGVAGALGKANDSVKAVGTGLLGDNALGNNLLPLGGAALLAYLMTRDRNRGSGGQGQNININVGGGGQGRTPAFFNRLGDVNSLSDAKFASLKEAGVADAVSKAIQTRAINKVLDKAEEEGRAESKPSEKEVEITSKYPEMQKMLEDKQNKAYLERLLKD